jgi:hypothetical protein
MRLIIDTICLGIAPLGQVLSTSPGQPACGCCCERASINVLAQQLSRHCSPQHAERRCGALDPMVAALVLQRTRHPAISVAMSLSKEQVCNNLFNEHPSAMLLQVTASTTSILCDIVCSMPNRVLRGTWKIFEVMMTLFGLGNLP